jgi:aminoacylase
LFFVDEEIGGTDGAAILVKSELFKEMNIEVAFDEGFACPRDAYFVMYGERVPWCRWKPGHDFQLQA